MSEAGHGYVMDVPYLGRAYPQHAPVHIRLAATLAGVEAPSLEPGSAVLELGCGFANGLISAAAAYPSCDFVGVDFNPTHIATARRRVADLDLANVSLLEADIVDLAADPTSLPTFDLVIAHGLYAWIGEREKAAIRTLLKRHVRSGGMVFLSYNALPGSAGMGLLQRALYEAASLSFGRSDQRLAAALAHVKRLRDAKAAHLNDNALIDSLFESIDEADSAYLIHEYLNAHWTPLYHAEVARDMEAAGLTFVGSAVPHEAFPDLMLNPDQKAALGDIPVSSVRETLRDFFIQRVLRKDLFVRGPRRLTERARDRTLDSVLLCAAVAPDDADPRVRVPAGRIDLDPPYKESLDMLWRDGHATLAALMAGPFANAGQTRAEAVALLAGAAMAYPCLGAPGPATVTACHRALARAVQAVHDEGLQARPGALAVRLGSEIPISGLEALVMDALARGRPADAETLVPEIWAPFEARGELVMHHGEAVSDPDRCRALLTDMVRAMLPDRLPLWRALGMMPEDCATG